MQSGRPAASGGFVELLVEVDAAPLELVLPLRELLPLLVLGVSLRTCLVTASQHFPALVVVVVALGEVVLVVVDVWATASPMFPANMAAVITPIPAIRIARSFLVSDEPGDPSPDAGENGSAEGLFLSAASQKESPR